MKFFFCMQVNKPFYELILSILVSSVAGLAHITQNNKFSKSLQYLEEKVIDKFHFCVDKHQIIQKVGTIKTDWCSQVGLKYSK